MKQRLLTSLYHQEQLQRQMQTVCQDTGAKLDVGDDRVRSKAPLAMPRSTSIALWISR